MMKKSTVIVIVIAAFILGALVAAGFHDKNERKANAPIANSSEHNEKMNKCVKIALERHPGAVIEMGLEKEDGKLIFDVDIKGQDGKSWEIECDADTAEIVEDELDRG